MTIEAYIPAYKKREFAIYALIDPRSKEWRYIGKTEQNVQIRYNVHWCDAWRKNKDGQYVKNLHTYRWIRSLGGLRPEFEKIEDCKNHEELMAAEMEWIAESRRQGVNLTNHTDGGEGSIGYTHSPETRKKISENKTGKTHTASPKTSNEKLKISRTKTGLTLDQQKSIASEYLTDNYISAGDVGKKYGVSASVVYTAIKAFGYKMRSQSETMKKIKPKIEREVVDKYLDGKSIKDLATEYSVSCTTILNLLKRLKIEIRPAGVEAWKARRKNGT